MNLSFDMSLSRFSASLWLLVFLAGGIVLSLRRFGACYVSSVELDLSLG